MQCISFLIDLEIFERRLYIVIINVTMEEIQKYLDRARDLICHPLLHVQSFQSLRIYQKRQLHFAHGWYKDVSA